MSVHRRSLSVRTIRIWWYISYVRVRVHALESNCPRGGIFFVAHGARARVFFLFETAASIDDRTVRSVPFFRSWRRMTLTYVRKATSERWRELNTKRARGWGWGQQKQHAGTALANPCQNPRWPQKEGRETIVPVVPAIYPVDNEINKETCKNPTHEAMLAFDKSNLSPYCRCREWMLSSPSQ